MAFTAISDLWTPDIWIPATAEAMASFPALFNSPVVVKNAQFDAIASGGGVLVTIPYFKDITDQADAIQVENTAPTVQTITGDKMLAPILNRVTANGITALSRAVSGDDPVGAITRQLGQRRLKQRQTTAVNVLRGLFGFAAAPGAGSACLKANRLDKFSETGASPSAGNTFTKDNFALAAALLGELQDELLGGAIWIHPDIYASLKAADPTSFDRPSNVPFVLERYKGIPIYVSSLLRRAGGVTGFVYDTYLFAHGVIAYGEKPQSGDTIEAASLSYFMDKDKNNETIYDRTRFLLQVNGTKWTGTPSGQSATNAELSTEGNWSYLLQSADRSGIVCVRTNA